MSFLRLSALGIGLLIITTIAHAQTIPMVRAGYVVVTPASANQAGLIALQKLRFQTAAGAFETDVPPAPVINTVAIPVDLGSLSEGSTGIAIVNPTATVGNVQLLATDAQGTEILNQTVSVLPRGQLARFLDEIFARQIVADTIRSGLLTITADVPVAVLAVNFRDLGFAALPVTSLVSPLPLPVITGQTARPVVTVTRSTPSFIGDVTNPVPSPEPLATGTRTAPGAPTIGGAGAVIFPQFANSNGWSTEIRVANTSSAAQIVRIDIFDPNGILLFSQANITIAPRGLYNLGP